ncbi:MAG: hypothetical protein M0Z95_11905 [Actinomycetota bacterium]|nr:hypothetical protein [Actinomycetota bacterium]
MIPPPPDWRQAACRGYPAAWFVSPVQLRPGWQSMRHLSWLVDFVDRVAPICEGCPIRDACGAWGERFEVFGAIYGGRLVISTEVETDQRATLVGPDVRAMSEKASR